MAIDRSTWRKSVYENFTNSYPCPRCQKGKVHRGESEIVLVEPHHSAEEHQHEAWEPDWIVRSFTTMLTCNQTNCGEVIAVCGRAGVAHECSDIDDFGGPVFEYLDWFQPVSMFPAPPLFPIIYDLPQSVKQELNLAFQLYWTDLSASTSRLRTSLERVLDDQNIETHTLNSKSNKKTRLNLFERINLFEETTKDADLSETMNAMRIVGNLGTHGDEVSEKHFFDLLDIYEDALSEIYDQKTAKLKAIKAELIALKK